MGRPEPRRPRAAPHATAWRGGAVNRGLMVVAIALLILGLVILGTRRDGAGIAIALCGPLIAVWSQIRVSVTAEAVIVRFGVAPWPRLTRPLRDVRAVNVAEVRPLRYGGWGLRGGPSYLIVLIRRGEALRLLNRNGTQFLVTVDNAEQAAAAVRAQLALLGSDD